MFRVFLSGDAKEIDTYQVDLSTEVQSASGGEDQEVVTRDVELRAVWDPALNRSVRVVLINSAAGY